MLTMARLGVVWVILTLALAACAPSAPQQAPAKTESKPAAQPAEPAKPAAQPAKPTAEPAKPAAAAKPERSKIEIYSAKDAQMAVQTLVAQSKGFLKDEGLEVDLKYYQSASEIPAGMAGGSIKVGLGGWVNPMQLAANDFPVKIVAPLSDIAGTTQLVAKKEIKTAKDLEGKKVAMLNIPIIRRFLVDFARVHGVDVSKITIVNTQPSDSLTAFSKGDVDAVLIWQPHTSIAVKDHGGWLMHTGIKSYIPGREGDYRVYYNYGVVFMAEDFVKSNPNTVAAYLRALAKAQDVVADAKNRDEVAKIIAQPLGMSEDLARQVLGENRYFMEISPEWLKTMKQEIDFYVAEKMLKKEIDPNKLVDGGPLKAVRPAWVTVNS
jgi:ABC-type nitrate/sulfonate/bicarbonate transport system substrate-binding protein